MLRFLCFELLDMLFLLWLFSFNKIGWVLPLIQIFFSLKNYIEYLDQWQTVLYKYPVLNTHFDFSSNIDKNLMYLCKYPKLINLL